MPIDAGLRLHVWHGQVKFSLDPPLPTTPLISYNKVSLHVSRLWVLAVILNADTAGFDTKNSFNVGLGAKGLAFIGTCGSWVVLTYWGRRPVYVSGLAILAVCLLLVGGVSFAADTNSNARWGSAALVLVWVFVYDFTVGVSSRPGGIKTSSS